MKMVGMVVGVGGGWRFGEARDQASYIQHFDTYVKTITLACVNLLYLHPPVLTWPSLLSRADKFSFAAAWRVTL